LFTTFGGVIIHLNGTNTKQSAKALALARAAEAQHIHHITWKS
jgi:hypothetical protein